MGYRPIAPRPMSAPQPTHSLAVRQIGLYCSCDCSETLARVLSVVSRAASICAGYEAFQSEQVGPCHAPSQPTHVVHAASGTPPWEHAIVQTASPQRAPVHPSSHVQLMAVAPMWQSPWSEQSDRLWQKAVAHCGPDQPSAHAQAPLTHAQSKQAGALQSCAEAQLPGDEDVSRGEENARMIEGARMCVMCA